MTAHPTRAYASYFIGLIAAYVAALVAFWPEPGRQPNQAIFLAVMFAPTGGALLALFFGGGHVRWGRLTWWILAGLIPALAVLAVDLLGILVGWDTVDPSVLRTALVGAPVAIGAAALWAVGEEIGWRGFLWPTLRERSGFWLSSLVIDDACTRRSDGVVARTTPAHRRHGRSDLGLHPGRVLAGPRQVG